MRDNLDDYIKYKERIEHLSDLKKKLASKVKELTKTRAEYLNYLKANPHKEPRKKLEKAIQDLRKKLMDLIPNKF